MPIGTATAIGLGGAALSAFGGKDKKTTSESKSGFQALPKEVQDFLLESYLPQVQERFASPYQAIPMQRAPDPSGDPFASQALYDLQQFSDVKGGYFTPRNGGLNQASYGNTGGLPSVPKTEGTGDAIVDQFLAAMGSGAGRGEYVSKGKYAGDVGRDISRGIETGGISRSGLESALQSQNYGAGVPITGIDLERLIRESA